MTTIVEVPFKGGSILFEARKDSGGKAFSAEDVLSRAEDSLDSAVDTVRRIGDAFAQELATLKYDAAEISLGLTITGKGKFIVAEASAEASLSVKLTFKAANAPS